MQVKGVAYLTATNTSMNIMKYDLHAIYSSEVKSYGNEYANFFPLVFQSLKML